MSIPYKQSLPENCTTRSCKNSGDTSPSWGVINLPITSHTAAPPSLSLLLARQKNGCKLKQSTLKGGRGSGKGLNSRFGRYWKLEKVSFNESVSTILGSIIIPQDFRLTFALMIGKRFKFVLQVHL